MPRGSVITGAGSGIGLATARTFLAAGWRVALIGRREAALAAAAGESPALILPCDVSDPAAVDAAFARIAAERRARDPVRIHGEGLFERTVRGASGLEGGLDPRDP